MHFMESLFGLAPDGGNGTYELALLGGAVALLALAWLSRGWLARKARALT
jgi:hypothetical protein